METSLTPLLAMKSSALLTLAILWKRILPRSGLGSVSPEITSSSSISFRPLRKSSSMFSIDVPALRRWELHHAVNVWNTTWKVRATLKIDFTSGNGTGRHLVEKTNGQRVASKYIIIQSNHVTFTSQRILATGKLLEQTESYRQRSIDQQNVI